MHCGLPLGVHLDIGLGVYGKTFQGSFTLMQAIAARH